MGILRNPFRRRPKKLHFAVVIADADTSGFKFIPDNNAKLFLFTGECDRHNVIPRTVLKSAMEKFYEPKKIDGDLKITEKDDV